MSETFDIVYNSMLLLLATAASFYLISLVNQRFQQSMTKQQTEDMIYRLAAAMVRSDGEIKQEELTFIERIGQHLHETFNAQRFREIVHEWEERPVLELAKDARDVLPPEKRKKVLYYLHAIAAADGEMHDAERRLISDIAEEWRLPMPQSITAI